MHARDDRDRQRRARFCAHGVAVAECVVGRDDSKYVRVVNEAAEEIHRVNGSERWFWCHNSAIVWRVETHKDL